MAQNWLNDPATGDYVLSGGSPVQTDSLQVPAYYRLKIQRNTWLYQPDTSYGSNFKSVKKRPSGGDTNDLENIAIAALQPILDDGRATAITVSTNQTTRATVSLETIIYKQRGVFDQLNIPSLGV